MSLSLISEDVPKIALEGFGFVVFFFLLIPLGSIANSDTNRITWWRGPWLAVWAAHRCAQLRFPALQFDLLLTAPPSPPFWFVVNAFERRHLFWKNYRLKKERKKERSCVPSWFLASSLSLSPYCVPALHQLTVCSISNTSFSWMMGWPYHLSCSQERRWFFSTPAEYFQYFGGDDFFRTKLSLELSR